MFLPVILLRELGWPAVIAFAVPNVVGCAAFGYLLRDPARRAALLERHRAAARWFSIVAVAYNAYFAAFLVSTLAPSPPAHGLAIAAGFAVIAGGFVLSRLPAAMWPVLAVAVYAVSIATLARLGVSDLATLPLQGAGSGLDLLWLAPVMVFGFLLCPYLDLTFHRAAAESPSRHTFAIFAATFALMLVLTCVYAGRMALAIVPMTHIGTQLLFTTGAHLRETRLGGARTTTLAAAVAGGGVLLVLAIGPGDATTGEQTYLRFLAFYSLIFPAYVLLFVGPGRVLDLSRRNLVAYAAAMLAGLPLFELAFFHGLMWLLIIPVAGILTWRGSLSLRA